MRALPCAVVISLSWPAFAFAAETGVVASVQKEDVRLLGKLNVNTASRDELREVPGLSEREVDQLVDARTRGPLRSLASFSLAPEAQSRLCLTGASTLRRIRPLPLEIYAQPSSATR